MLKSSIWIAYCLSSVVCPSAVAFKQQHLWNHWASLNLTSPECSLHGPLTHLWNLLSSMQKSVCNCNQMVVIKALLFSNLLTDLKNNLEWMFLGWPIYKSKYILKLIFFFCEKIWPPNTFYFRNFKRTSKKLPIWFEKKLAQVFLRCLSIYIVRFISIHEKHGH